MIIVGYGRVGTTVGEAAHGATGRSVYAEREAALSLAHYALLSVGKTDDEAASLVDGMRRQATAPTETFKALQTQEFHTLSRGL